MVFKKNFVVSIKSNGKILREQDGTIYLPVGEEYSILLKNLHCRKALVSIEIDGEDVLDGHNLVIEPNSTTELERFMNKKNKFKFIEKTEKISQHRGDKLEDGIVRVKYIFEKEKPEFLKPIIRDYKNPHWNYEWNWDEYPDKKWWKVDEDTTEDNSYFVGYNQSVLRNSSFELSNQVVQDNFEEYDGITAYGSESNQEFIKGNIGELERNSHVITLQLKGKKSTGNKVEKPLTVRDKLVCNMCGTSNKSNHKFCVECGTYLL